MKLFSLTGSDLAFLKHGMAVNATVARDLESMSGCVHCEAVCYSGCGANCSGGCGGRSDG